MGSHPPWGGVTGREKQEACPVTLCQCQVSASQPGNVMKREQDYEVVGECLRCRLGNVKRGSLNFRFGV